MHKKSRDGRLSELQFEKMSREAMKKILKPGFVLLLFLLITFLVSGCSAIRYFDGSTPEQIDQFQHPVLWHKIAKIEVQESENQRQIDDQRREVIQIREVQANIGRQTEIIQGQVKVLTEEEYIKMRTDRKVEGAENQLKASGAAAPGIAAPTPDSDRTPALIKAVRYKKDSKGYDKIIIALDRDKTPTIFSIKGNKPRIVIDFTHTTLGKGVRIKMATKGNYIRGIRVGKHLKPVQKTRIVLDLAKDKKYLVDRAFHQKETIYVLTIKK